MGTKPGKTGVIATVEGNKKKLKEVRYYWEDHFSGALCYADDLTILAPCPDALRKMLAHCEEFAESHGIRFNASKTQLICFRRTSQPDRSRFWFCGQLLPSVDSVLHLGNTLQYDLSDKLDVQRKSMAFIRQANSILHCFRAADPPTKMRLFHAYCLSLYGCSLWRLDCPALRSLGVTFNQVIRRIWYLPRNWHTAIVHSVRLISSIFNIAFASYIHLPCHIPLLLFVRCLLSARNPVIRTLSVTMFGSRHCKFYSSNDVALGQLIREIRCTHYHVPNFSLPELNAIVLFASTS